MVGSSLRSDGSHDLGLQGVRQMSPGRRRAHVAFDLGGAASVQRKACTSQVQILRLGRQDERAGRALDGGFREVGALASSEQLVRGNHHRPSVSPPGG